MYMLIIAKKTKILLNIAIKLLLSDLKITITYKSFIDDIPLNEILKEKNLGFIPTTLKKNILKKVHQKYVQTNL